MSEINLDWKCRMCGSVGFGEEHENENGDIEVTCECGNSEIIEEHEEFDNGGVNGH